MSSLLEAHSGSAPSCVRRWAVIGSLGLALLMVSDTGDAADCAVLLHGLARGSSSMNVLAEALADDGFVVHNIDYPSTSAGVEQLSVATVGAALNLCADAPRVHFVTHSLGGILVRQQLALQQPPNMGKVVMLGPPNGGSELVDQLGEFPGFAWINGPAGSELGTDPRSIPRNLPAVDYPVGVIAGNRSMNPLYSGLLPGPDDGKVTVQSTHVQGEADHRVLPVSHTFMMRDDTVIRQTLHFLHHGRFEGVP